MFGDEVVNYTGQVAFRALLPMANVPAGIAKFPFAMFVGNNRVLLHYPLRHRTIMNVIGVAREPRWQEEGWTLHATIEEFANFYGDLYPDALALICAISPKNRCSNGDCATASRCNNMPKDASRCWAMPHTR